MSSLWTQGRLVPALPGPQPRRRGPLLPGWVSAEAHSSLGGQRAISSETKEALGPERPSVSWCDRCVSAPLPEPKRPPRPAGGVGAENAGRDSCQGPVWCVMGQAATSPSSALGSGSQTVQRPSFCSSNELSGGCTRVWRWGDDGARGLHPGRDARPAHQPWSTGLRAGLRFQRQPGSTHPPRELTVVPAVGSTVSP